MASISSGPTWAIDAQTATSNTRLATSARLRGVSFLESSRPSMRGRSGSTTAAAVSGPASAPRPTSSTPAIDARSPGPAGRSRARRAAAAACARPLRPRIARSRRRGAAGPARGGRRRTRRSARELCRGPAETKAARTSRDGQTREASRVYTSPESNKRGAAWCGPRLKSRPGGHGGRPRSPSP